MKNLYLYDEDKGEIFITPNKYNEYETKIHLPKEIISHIFLDYKSGYLIIKGNLSVNDEKSSYELMKLSQLKKTTNYIREKITIILYEKRKKEKEIIKLNFDGVLLSYSELSCSYPLNTKSFEIIFYNQ